MAQTFICVSSPMEKIGTHLEVSGKHAHLPGDEIESACVLLVSGGCLTPYGPYQ